MCLYFIGLYYIIVGFKTGMQFYTIWNTCFNAVIICLFCTVELNDQILLVFVCCFLYCLVTWFNIVSCYSYVLHYGLNAVILCYNVIKCRMTVVACILPHSYLIKLCCSKFPSCLLRSYVISDGNTMVPCLYYVDTWFILVFQYFLVSYYAVTWIKSATLLPSFVLSW